MKGLGKTKIVEKKILSLFIVTGLAFSGISVYSLLELPVNVNSEIMAMTGLDFCSDDECFSAAGQNEFEPIFVPQNELTKSQVLESSQIEDFSDLKFSSEKTPERQYQLTGNKATLFAEKDSFVREGVRTTNEGSNKILRVMGTENTNNRVLIAFNQEDIKNIASYKKLESATLKLHVKSNDNHWEAGQLINIYPLESEWSEGSSSHAPFSNLKSIDSGVTWNCATGADNCINWNGGLFPSTPTDSVLVSNQIQKGYWIKFDVTSDVQEFLTGTPHYGWIIMKSEEDLPGRINFESRESQANIPELVLVFEK